MDKHEKSNFQSARRLTFSTNGYQGENPMRHTVKTMNRTSQHIDRQRADRLRQPSGDFEKRFSPLKGESHERTHKTSMRRRSLVSLHARMRQDISNTADALMKEGGKLAGNSPDTADLASELTEQDVAVSLLDSARGTFDQISIALDRMDEGRYGYCEDCGVEIPVERLEALPYAVHCVHCAARREKERAR
jgi:RNA polymerase-binding protein DksA